MNSIIIVLIPQNILPEYLQHAHADVLIYNYVLVYYLHVKNTFLIIYKYSNYLRIRVYYTVVTSDVVYTYTPVRGERMYE